MQTVTDFFREQWNGLMLPRNATLWEEPIIPPADIEHGLCLRAHMTIHAACSELFVFVKTCKSSFDDVIRNCTNGPSPGTGITDTFGSEYVIVGCGHYELDIAALPEGC